MSKTAQSILKNTAWLVSSEAIGKILMFFLTIYIARILGDKGFGQFSFIFSFVALFAIFADLGLSKYITREVARHKESAKNYFENILFLKLILGILTVGLIVVIIQFLGKETQIVNLVYLAALYTVSESFINFSRGYFRAFEKMKYEAIINTLERTIVALLGLGVLFTQIFPNKLLALIVIYLIGSFFSVFISFLIIKIKFAQRFRFQINWSLGKKIVSETWPFSLSVIFVTIYFNIDSVMLSLMKDDQTVGWYNAAFRFVFFVLLFINILVNVFFPVISRFYKDNKEGFRDLLNKFAKLMVILGLPVGFGGVALASKIISLIYGPEYLNSILPLQIMIWALVLVFINVVYANALQASDKQKTYLKGAILGAIINIVLNGLLIPIFSLRGAALATVITQLTVLVYLYQKVQKITKVTFYKPLFKSLIASLLMFLLLLWFGDLNLFILIALGFVSYLLILFLLGGIKKEDLRILKSIKEKSIEIK